MGEPKPTGSGYFAAFCGGLFGLAFVVSLFTRIDQLPPEWIMRMWFLFVSAILIYWGVNRVRTGNPSATVGQDTVNLVVAIIGASFVLIGVLKG